MKSLRSCSRFYFICFLTVIGAFVFSILLNLTLPLVSGTVFSALATYQTHIAIPASFTYMLMFILPGFLAAVQLVKRDLVKRKHLLLISFALSSLLAYLVFWVYYFNNIVGRVVSIIIVVLCIILFALRLKSLKEYILEPIFIRPLTLCFIVGCLYSAILLLYGSGNIVTGDLSAIASNRFSHQLPSDGILPRILMDRMYRGDSLKPFVEFWLASDRPPLATAILLLLYPLNIFTANGSVFYQVFGAYVQLLWIPALYYLCEYFALPRRIRNFIITCAVFSGVFIINSVFLWPKLSTTIYVCLLLFLTLELADEKKNTVKAMVTSVMIGILAALSLLTHGGIVFSLIALGLAVLVCEKRFKYNYRDILYALGSFIAVYTPWNLYQTFVDPPGNVLSRVHLAGPDIDASTVTEAMAKYYTETPVADIIHAKIQNFFTMFEFDIMQFVSIHNIRNIVFFRTFGTATVLNLFIIIAILYFVYRYCFKKERLNYNYRIMLWFTIFSFTVWPLLMHSGTIIHQGSYFNLLLLYFLIALGVKHTSKHLTRPIFFANLSIFFFVFFLRPGFTIPDNFLSMSGSMLLLAFLSATVYFVYTYIFDADERLLET